MDKKAQFTFKIIVEVILVLLVIVSAFFLFRTIVRAKNHFEYQELSNEKLAETSYAYIPMMSTSTKLLGLRERKEIFMNSKVYGVTIDCTDTTCARLNATFEIKPDEDFIPLKCDWNSNHVIFDNPGLACCGNYICVYADVNDNYKVSLTAYTPRNYGDTFVLPFKNGFVLKDNNEEYRVSLVDSNTPWVRAGGASFHYYNFLVIDDNTNKAIHCSGRRGKIIKTHKFICDQRVPFFLSIDNMEKACKITILNKDSSVGTYTPP